MATTVSKQQEEMRNKFGNTRSPLKDYDPNTAPIEKYGKQGCKPCKTIVIWLVCVMISLKY